MKTFNSMRRSFLSTGGLGVAADARPAFCLKNVERADFFAVSASRSAEGAFALHDVKDLRIGWSRAASDATLTDIDSKSL